MTVFVLCGGWDYEGQDVLGAYASLAEAQAVGRALSGYDYVEVCEVQIGAAAASAGRDLSVWFERLGD